MSLYELFFGISEEHKAKFPWVFANENIDRHKCTRVVPMQVLSLGMGRTGTASMQKALTTLGYPTSHGFDLHRNHQDADMWNEAFEAKYFGDTSVTLDANFWDKLLGHVSAVTDFPAMSFAKELMESYPDAKVILVERDVDSWYPSFEQALIKTSETPGLDLIGWLVPDIGRMLPLVRRGLRQGQFGARDGKEYRANAKSVYKKHYQDIRETLRDQPGRLLEYKLGSGWKPLCDFLGQPIPDSDFPRVNETAMHDEMGNVVLVMLTRQCVGIVAKWMIPVAIAMLAYLVWRRTQSS